jgi:hypothetical protein
MSKKREARGKIKGQKRVNGSNDAKEAKNKGKKIRWE